MPYNESYINDFREDAYLRVLSDRRQLEMLARNHLNRLDTMHPYYASRDLFRESLDNYCAKRYDQDPNFYRSKEFSNYLEYLSNIISMDQTEVLTNAFYRIHSSAIQSFLEPAIRAKEQTAIEEIKRIEDIFYKQHQLNQHDLDIFADYHNKLRDFDSKGYQDLLTYIISNKNNIQISHQVSSLVASASAYFQPMANNPKLKPSDIRVILSDFTADDNIFRADSYHVGTSVFLRRTAYVGVSKFGNISQQVQKGKLDNAILNTMYQTDRMVAKYGVQLDTPLTSKQDLGSIIDSVINKQEQEPLTKEEQVALSKTNAMKGVLAMHKAYYNAPDRQEILNACETAVKYNATPPKKQPEVKPTSGDKMEDIRRLNKEVYDHPEVLEQHPELKQFYGRNRLMRPHDYIFKKDAWRNEYITAFIKVYLGNGRMGPFLSHLEANDVEYEPYKNMINNIYHAIKNNLNAIEYPQQPLTDQESLQLLKETLKEYSTARDLLTRVSHLTNSKQEVNDLANKYIEHLDKVMEKVVSKSKLEQREKIDVINKQMVNMDETTQQRVEEERMKVVKSRAYQVTKEELDKLTPEERIAYYQTKKKEAIDAGANELAVMYINKINKENANIIRSKKGL